MLKVKLKWSSRYEECRHCHAVHIPHKSRGLCEKCYVFLWQYVSGRDTDDPMAKHFQKIFNDHIVGKK